VTLPAPVRLGGGRLLTFERARVMGVVNVTPDSFSDGGRFLDREAAVAHALDLVRQGADLLDIGGESTRPGSAPVDPATQIARVVPVVTSLRERGCTTPLSVDTTSAAVAGAALAAGADLINDISAFRFDPDMLPLLAARGAAAVAMHTLAAPSVMQADPRYGDVVADVRDHLAERLAACVAAGLARTQVLVDPGIGFGKTLTHNLLLLRHLPELAALGQAVLVGTSRKRFLGELTGQAVDARGAATAASVAVAIALGAHVVRVHDVAGVREAVAVADAIARGAPPRAADGG
jgi:dihydropteroate synthase